MTRYSLKDFIKIVKNADIIYGNVSLNAAVNVTSRIKKKSLLEKLEDIKKETLYMTHIGYYGDLSEDNKGRKILRVI